MTRYAEVSLKCELCDQPAEYADSVPDGNAGPKDHQYRWKPFCWLHAIERRQVATSRVQPIARCEKQQLGRIDRDRCGGDCLCPDCGRKYYDHPKDIDFPFLNVLCDGSVVKL